MSKLLKIIVFLFLLQTSSFADCRYEASGEVQGDKIINKVEKVVCDEEEKKPNFLVSAMTGESSGIFFQYFFGTIFFIIENL